MSRPEDDQNRPTDAQKATQDLMATEIAEKLQGAARQVLARGDRGQDALTMLSEDLDRELKGNQNAEDIMKMAMDKVADNGALNEVIRAFMESKQNGARRSNWDQIRGREGKVNDTMLAAYQEHLADEDAAVNKDQTDYLVEFEIVERMRDRLENDGEDKHGKRGFNRPGEREYKQNNTVNMLDLYGEGFDDLTRGRNRDSVTKQELERALQTQIRGTNSDNDNDAKESARRAQTIQYMVDNFGKMDNNNGRITRETMLKYARDQKVVFDPADRLSDDWVSVRQEQDYRQQQAEQVRANREVVERARTQQAARPVEAPAGQGAERQSPAGDAAAAAERQRIAALTNEVKLDGQKFTTPWAVAREHLKLSVDNPTDAAISREVARIIALNEKLTPGKFSQEKLTSLTAGTPLRLYETEQEFNTKKQQWLQRFNSRVPRN